MGFGSAVWSGVKWTGKKAAAGFAAGMGAVGGATMKAGYAAGEAAVKAAPTVAEKSVGLAEGIGNAVLTGLETGGKMALGAGKYFGDAMIDINPAKYDYSLFGAGLTGKGKAFMYGSALVAGSVGAYHDYETTQMGTPSGEVVTPTPRINYTHFGEEMGATGDLVFAMNRNRRHGYM